jgi:hypothetical protein
MVFQSGTTINTPENITDTANTALATDADNDTVNYTISGGNDLDKFQLVSGALSFLAAPDFETPSDSATNNTYEVEITASDGFLTSSQSVTINVIDALEMSVTIGGYKELPFNWADFSGASYYRLLVNPDGASGFTQDSVDIIGSSVNVEFPEVYLMDWINAEYILEAYDASDSLIASSESTSIVSEMLSSISYFKASNPNANDRFGYSVSLAADGNTLAAGAHKENSNATGVNVDQSDNSVPSAGAVYLY